MEVLCPGSGDVFSALFQTLLAHKEKTRVPGRSGLFDDAASAAMTPYAIAAQSAINAVLTANSNSTHIGGVMAKRANDSAKTILAQLVNHTHPSLDSVIFTAGGTAANTFVLTHLIPATPKKLGGGAVRDVLLIGRVEHPSVVHNPQLEALKRGGYEIIQVDPYKGRKFLDGDRGMGKSAGSYDLEALEGLLEKHADRIALLSTQHGNSEVGATNNMKVLNQTLKKHCPNAVHHADCIQTFGKIPIDASHKGNVPVDALTISFHKVGGPKRSGAVFLTKGPEAIISQKVLKATDDVASNVAGVLAAEVAVAAIPKNFAKMKRLAGYFTERVEAAAEEAKIRMNILSPPCTSSLGDFVPGIVNILFPGLQAAHFVTLLGEHSIRVSSGSACSSQSNTPSHVLSSIGIHNTSYFSAVRFSFSAYLEEGDVDFLLATLKPIFEKLQLMQNESLKKLKKTDHYRQDEDEQSRMHRGKKVRDRDDAAPTEQDQAPKKRKVAEGKVVKVMIDGVSEEEHKMVSRSEPEQAARFVAQIKELVGPSPVAVDIDEITSYNAISLSLGELCLKGGKRREYERQQISNLVTKLRTLSGWPAGLTAVSPAGFPDAGFILLMTLAPEHRDIVKKRKPKGIRLHPALPPPVHRFSRTEYQELLPVLSGINGIATITPLNIIPPTVDALENELYRSFFRSYFNRALQDHKEKSIFTFGMKFKRTDKNFPIGSDKIQTVLGAHIFLGVNSDEFKKHFETISFKGERQADAAHVVAGLQKGVTINLRQTDVSIETRMRQDCALVYEKSDVTTGAGGLPDGIDKPDKSGRRNTPQQQNKNRVLSLLSGGHDSPISSYKTINRGCQVGYIHFDGYPYVPKEVVLKIRRIAQKLNEHQSSKTEPLYVVPFSGIQEIIARTKGVSPSLRTVLYRVYMFQIAERVAEANGYSALCTGDNLGQVASQTLSNMVALDKRTNMFVLRPLLTFAKNDILDICEKLDLFSLTKLYGTADCCTVFKVCRSHLPLQGFSSQWGATSITTTPTSDDYYIFHILFRHKL